nr:type II toxin-antitoxin system ParD family antitoxin [Jiella mangrovi]
MSPEQAAFIDRLVASGAYASADDVIRDGLRTLEERDGKIERWLRDEVAGSYDRWQADQNGFLTPEEMAERARCRDAAGSTGSR